MSEGNLQIQLTDVQVDAIFQLFDDDCDGKLTFNEGRNALNAWKYFLQEEFEIERDLMKFSRDGVEEFAFHEFRVTLSSYVSIRFSECAMNEILRQDLPHDEASRMFRILLDGRKRLPLFTMMLYKAKTDVERHGFKHSKPGCCECRCFWNWYRKVDIWFEETSESIMEGCASCCSSCFNMF